MNEFLEKLGSWRGRPYVQGMVESGGFVAHRVFQEAVEKWFLESAFDRLEEYWNELAKEYVLSAGTTDSGNRAFLLNGVYRSRYLDELSVENVKNADSKYASVIHPGMVAFHDYWARDREVSSRVFSTIEAEKSNKTLQIWPDQPDLVTVDDSGEVIKNTFREGAKLRGFKMKGGYSGKLEVAGLVFQVYLESSRVSWSVQLPISISIASSNSMDDVFSSIDVNRIIPGLSYFSSYKSNRTAMYGVLAYLELVCALARSFGDVSD